MLNIKVLLLLFGGFCIYLLKYPNILAAQCLAIDSPPNKKTMIMKHKSTVRFLMLSSPSLLNSDKDNS